MMCSRTKVLDGDDEIMMQVGPGDDYVLTVGGFNDNLSTLGDSMITPWSDYNLNGMRFSTR